MKIWRISKLDQSCGSCRGRIREGEKFLDVQLRNGTHMRRCKTCGESMLHEPAPEVVPDDDDESLAMPDIRYQPSLGLELQPSASVSGFVSTGELARRRVANHLKHRGRR